MKYLILLAILATTPSLIFNYDHPSFFYLDDRVLSVINARGVTIGSFVLISKNEINGNDLGLIVAHELQHVEQYRRLGFWGMTLAYSAESFKALWTNGYINSFEAEAHEAESNLIKVE
jgi:hypothetical protein